MHIDLQQKSEAKSLNLALLSFELTAVLEGIKRVSIGRKSLLIGLGGVEVSMQDRDRVEPVLAGSAPSKAVSAEEVESKEESKEILSSVTVQVLRVRLAQAASPHPEELRPYCAVSLATSSEEQTTAECSQEAEMDAGEATFVFGGKRELRFDATCQDKMRLVVLQQHSRNRGFLGMFPQRGKAVVRSDKDEILGEVTFPVEAPSWDELAFSRISQGLHSFDTWKWLDDDKGQVLLRFSVTPSVVPLSLTDDPLLNLEIAAATSVGAADAALGLTLERLHLAYNERFEGFSNALSTAYDASQLPVHVDEHVAWRCRNTFLNVKVLAVAYGGTTLTPEHFSVKCEAEHLSTKTIGKALRLGLLQSLEQVRSTATLELTFFGSDSGTPHTMKILLKEALSLPDPLQASSYWAAGEDASMARRVAAEEVKASKGLVVTLELRKFLGKALGDRQRLTKKVSSRTELSRFDPSWFVPSKADMFGVTQYPAVWERPFAKLQVQVLEARGLAAADFGGSSDPYCIVKCEEEEFRSHVCNNTLTPVWSSSDEANVDSTRFEFGPFPRRSLLVQALCTDELVITVKDKDPGGDWTDDTLGIAQLNLAEVYNQYADSTLWLPLHLPGKGTDTDKEEEDGAAVRVAFRFEQVAARKVAQPAVPLQMNLSVIVSAKLPTVHLSEELSLNKYQHDMRIDLGEPKVSFEVNEGASWSVQKELSIIKKLNRSTESLETLEDKEEESDEDGGGLMDEEEMEFKSCRDADFDEDRSFLTGIDPDAYGKGDGEYLGVNTEAQAKKPSNVYNQVRLGLDVSIDKLYVRLDTFSESRQAFVPFAQVSLVDIEIAAGIDVTVEDSEAAVNLNAAIGEMVVEDGLQEHAVMGRHLCKEDQAQDKLKQVCLKVTYGLPNELVQFADVQPKQLSLGLQLNDMYVLATALGVLASNVQALFHLPPDEDAPVEDTSIAVSGEAEEQEEAGGMAIPATAVLVQVSLQGLEVHLMNRKTLGLQLPSRMPEKLPPKSLVVTLNNRVEYVVEACPGKVGLPQAERVVMLTDASACIKRTKLQPHMYEEAPMDMDDNEYVLVEPFELLVEFVGEAQEDEEETKEEVEMERTGLRAVGTRQRVIHMLSAKELNVYVDKPGLKRLEVVLSGFETKLDTGEYKFLLQVADVHSGDLTTLVQDTPSLKPENGRIVTPRAPISTQAEETQVTTCSPLPAPKLDSNTQAVSKLLPDEEKTLEQEEPQMATVPAWLYPAYGAVFILGFERDLEVADTEAQQVEARQAKLQEKAELVQKEVLRTNAAMDVRVSIRHVTVAVGNNLEGFPVPFLRLVVQGIGVEGKSLSVFENDGVLVAEVEVECSSYNKQVKAWEYLLEPWLVRCNVRISQGHQLVEVTAPFRMNLTVTESLLESVNKLAYYNDPDYIPLVDERLYGTFCPNWIVNETGHPIDVWPVEEPEQVEKHRILAQTVLHNQAQKVHLKDTAKLRKGGRLLLRRLMKKRRRERLAARRKLGRKGRALYTFFEDRADELNPREILTELFQEIDQDGSGEISVKELHQAYHSHGLLLSYQEVMYEIGLLDDQGVEKVDFFSTGIDLHEFLSFFLDDSPSSANMKVSSLAIAVKELPDRVHPPVVLAPANNAGDYVLRVNTHSDEEEKEAQSLVGSVEKMGIAAVADVLFITTPVRVENRLGHSIEVLCICKDKVLATVFILDPGDEESVPLRYLDNSQGPKQGLAFRPLPLKHHHRRRRTLSSTSRRAHRYSSVESIGSTSSDGVTWARSAVIVEMEGGYKLGLPVATREEDKLGLDKEQGLLESIRVKAEVEEEWQQEVDVQNVFNFEAALLIQENSLRPFQFKRVLTVQIISASGLRAADLGRSSDPYVSVRIGEERFQTPTIENELDPVWASGATFRFGENKPLDETASILIKVYDYDLTANDILGYKTLSVAEVIAELSQEDARSKNVVELAESDDSMDNCIVKTYRLEAGEGLSERKVQGSIKILLAYDVYSVATQTPKDGAQRVLSLYPSYIIDNLLPLDAEIRFSLKGQSWQYIVPSGCDLSFTDMDGALLDFLLPSKGKATNRNAAEVVVQMRVKDGDRLSAWSDPLKAAGEAVALRHAAATDKSQPLLAVAAVECVRDLRQDGGARRLVVFAPWWMMNRTDCDLVYSSAELKVAQDLGFGSHEDKVLPIVLPDNELTVEARISRKVLRTEQTFKLSNEEDIEQSPYLLLTDPNNSGGAAEAAQFNIVVAVGISKYVHTSSAHREGSKLLFSIAVEGQGEEQAKISPIPAECNSEGFAKWTAASLVFTLASTLARATLLISFLDEERSQPIAAPLRVKLSGISLNGSSAQGSLHVKASEQEVWLNITEIARKPGRREVAVETVPLGGKQVRTQLIRLTPKYELANVMPHGVFIKQYGAKNASAVYLPPKAEVVTKAAAGEETEQGVDDPSAAEATVVPFHLGGPIEGVDEDFATYAQLRVDLPGERVKAISCL